MSKKSILEPIPLYRLHFLFWSIMIHPNFIYSNYTALKLLFVVLKQRLKIIGNVRLNTFLVQNWANDRFFMTRSQINTNQTRSLAMCIAFYISLTLIRPLSSSIWQIRAMLSSMVEVFERPKWFRTKRLSTNNCASKMADIFQWAYTSCIVMQTHWEFMARQFSNG